MKIFGFNIASSHTDRVSADDLLTAIEQNKLCLYYLPLIDVQTKKMVEVEALLRWPQKHDEFTPPMKFIPMAEKNDLMPRLSRWVIQTATKQIAVWRGQGLNVNLTINLSSYDFSDLELVGYIDEQITKNELSASTLGFEVPQVALNQSNQAMEFIMPLEETGVRIVLDNVRSESLESLPEDCEACNTLKIDHSLIMDMLHKQTDKSAVQMIISSAVKRDLRVVAPGVFSKQVWDMISQMGCQFAQGFYLSPPQAASELDVWFRMSSWRPDKLTSNTAPSAPTAQAKSKG